MAKYAFLESRHGDRFETIMLVEAKDWRGDLGDNRRISPTTADRAHRWVASGATHATGLYIDEGRIRYAKGDPA